MECLHAPDKAIIRHIQLPLIFVLTTAILRVFTHFAEY